MWTNTLQITYTERTPDTVERNPVRTKTRQNENTHPATCYLLSFTVSFWVISFSWDVIISFDTPAPNCTNWTTRHGTPMYLSINLQPIWSLRQNIRLQTTIVGARSE